MVHQVCFSDNDAAETNAIELVFPGTVHKLCIWHTYGNIREHGGGLGEGVLSEVIRKFRKAAFAQTVEVRSCLRRARLLYDVLVDPHAC